jgi:hypothetical protein
MERSDGDASIGRRRETHLEGLLDELSREVPGSLTIASGDEAAGYVVYRLDRVKLADAERRQVS